MNTALIIVIILSALLLVAWLPFAIRTLRRAFHSDDSDRQSRSQERHSWLDPQSQTDNKQK